MVNLTRRNVFFIVFSVATFVLVSTILGVSLTHQRGGSSVDEPDAPPVDQTGLISGVGGVDEPPSLRGSQTSQPAISPDKDVAPAKALADAAAEKVAKAQAEAAPKAQAEAEAAAVADAAAKAQAEAVAVAEAEAQAAAEAAAKAQEEAVAVAEAEAQAAAEAAAKAQEEAVAVAEAEAQAVAEAAAKAQAEADAAAVAEAEAQAQAEAAAVAEAAAKAQAEAQAAGEQAQNEEASKVQADITPDGVSIVTSSTLTGQPLQELPTVPFSDIKLRTTMYDYKGYTHDMRFRALHLEGQEMPFPAPVLSITRGTTIRLELCNTWENAIGDMFNPPAPAEGSKFHSQYYANVHTHGLHVDGNDPGDNVLRDVAPGDCYQYSYDIPDFHIPGLHFIHSHKHHAGTIHGTGIMPINIVEEERDNLPADLQAMNQKILTMQLITPLTLGEVAQCMNDPEFATKPNNGFGQDDSFMLVNGQHNPVLDMQAGVWQRWQILYYGTGNPMQLRVTDATGMDMIASGTCKLRLYAKDGIPLFDAPRAVDYILMSIANRADIAVSCSTPGDYQLSNGMSFEEDWVWKPAANTSATDCSIDWKPEEQFYGSIMGIHVAGAGTTVAPDLARWSYPFPNYVQPLCELDPDTERTVVYQERTMSIHGGENSQVAEYGSFESLAVNGYYLPNETKDTVSQWTINAGGNHHIMHHHIWPVQYCNQNFKDADEYPTENIDPGNWLRKGDFVDVFQDIYHQKIAASSSGGGAYTYNLRFHFVNYGNTDFVFHCHIPTHADMGMKAVARID